jgi:hypothetical protein
MTSLMTDPHAERRRRRRRRRLLFLAHWVKSIGLAVTFQLGRLGRERRLWRERCLIARSWQFDADWYRASYPEVASAGVDPITHYLQEGAAKGCNPHPLFDTNWYLSRYPDVRESGANPLVHFIQQGGRDGRDPGPLFSSAWILEREPRATDLGPLGAYLWLGRPRSRRRRTPAGLRTPQGQDAPGDGIAILEYRRAKKSGNRIVAFTVITGNYDTLRVPRVLDPDIDYVCFSDTPRSDLGFFEIRPLPFRHADPVRAARYVKTHGHLLFPKHDIAVWMDATAIITSDVKPLIARLIAANLAVAGIPHPRSHDIYDEAYLCAYWCKDDPVTIAAHVARYLAAGVPKGLAVPDTSFMIWNLRHAATAQLLDAWWHEIEAGSRRDQMSFSVALWRNGGEWMRLFGTAEPGLRKYPGLVLRPHVPSDGSIAVLPPGVPARVIDPSKGAAFQH